jgi:hypothetical protein
VRREGTPNAELPISNFEWGRMREQWGESEFRGASWRF